MTRQNINSAAPIQVLHYGLFGGLWIIGRQMRNDLFMFGQRIFFLACQDQHFILLGEKPAEPCVTGGEKDRIARYLRNAFVKPHIAGSEVLRIARRLALLFKGNTQIGKVDHHCLHARLAHHAAIKEDSGSFQVPQRIRRALQQDMDTLIHLPNDRGRFECENARPLSMIDFNQVHIAQRLHRLIDDHSLEAIKNLIGKFALGDMLFLHQSRIVEIFA